MKRKILSLTIAIASMVTIFSACKKDAKSGSPTGTAKVEAGGTMDDLLAEEGVDADKVVVNYFVDGETSDRPITDFEDNFPVFSATKNTATRSAVITVNTFSSEEKYFEYGDVHGLKFREADAFGKEIYAAGKARGIAVDGEEVTEELPDDFTAYVNNKYKEYFGEPMIGPFGKATFGTGSFYGWDDIVPYGSGSIFPLPTHPRLFSWNNRIGCIEGYTVVSTFILFDKWFYSKRIGVITRWGFSKISFSSYFGLAHFNNKTTSYIHLTFL